MSLWATDEERIRTAHGVMHVKYMSLVSATVWFADWVFTLDLEVSLIWRRRWSSVKIIFLLSRYTALFDIPLSLVYFLAPHLSLEACKDLNSAIFWIGTSGVAFSEAILILRAHALSGRSQGLFVYLVVQYLGLCVAAITVLSVAAHTLTYGPHPIPTMPGCYVVGGSPFIFLLFVLVLLHETIVMIITLVIGYRKYRSHRSPLVYTLYGDGASYFILLFLVSFANIINLVYHRSTAHPGNRDLFTAFQRVMHSVLSARILLHVRETAQSDAFDNALSKMLSLAMAGIGMQETSRGSDASNGVQDVAMVRLGGTTSDDDKG